MAQEPLNRDARKMSEAVVSKASNWAEALLSRVYRGPGDTIDAAMWRAEQKYGVPAQTFWSLRYRPPKDILASVYLRLQHAYECECELQAARLKHEITLARRMLGDEAHEALLDEAEALALYVGRKEGGEA